MKTTEKSKYENELYLLEQFELSNPKAFEYLFKTYYNRILIYALNYSDDKSQAEDIAKDVFIKIWNTNKKFQSLEHLKNTLYQITKQLGINQQISNERMLNREKIYQSKNAQHEDAHIHKMIYSEVMSELYDAIQQLPHQTKKVIISTYLDGKSNKEVADEMNISLQTVKNYKIRAIAHLRKLISPKAILFLITLHYF